MIEAPFVVGSVQSITKDVSVVAESLVGAEGVEGAAYTLTEPFESTEALP